MGSEKYRERIDQFLNDSGHRKAVVAKWDTSSQSDRTVLIPFMDLDSEHSDLADLLQTKPTAFTDAMNDAINELRPPDANGQHAPIVRFDKLPDVITMKIHGLRAKNIGKMVRVRARLREIRDVEPKFTRILFDCLRCNSFKVSYDQPRDTTAVDYPARCDKKQGGCGSYGSRTSFAMDIDKSEKHDVQIGTLEDIMDPNDLQPVRKLRVWFENDLVGRPPVNRMTVTGTLEARLEKDGKTTRFLRVHHIEDSADITRKLALTPEDRQESKDFLSKPDAKSLMVDSIATSVAGMDEVKECILVALARGVDKELKDGTRERGKIHIMLVGDPGTAKSKILKTLPPLVPTESMYSTGERSTGKGLTVAYAKDDVDKIETVRMGLLPMCHEGVAIEDELDKYRNSDDLNMANTALEDGVVHYKLAGLTGSVPADCTFIAGANPQLRRFDPRKSAIEQIAFPQDTLSRFDIILAIHDTPNRERDGQILDYILETHMRYDDPNFVARDPPVPPQLFKKLLAYMWELAPRLTGESAAAIKESFLQLRQASTGEFAGLIDMRGPATFIRVAEAYAKLDDSETVDVKHVRAAERVLNFAFESACGGDFELLTTGIKGEKRTRLQWLLDFIRDCPGFSEHKILEAAVKGQGFSSVAVSEDIEELRNNCQIEKRGYGYFLPGQLEDG